MRIGKLLAAAALACSGALAATPASAQAFLGAAIGQSEIDAAITEGLITSGTFDGKDTAWKLYGGYMFNRHFGFESAFVGLGDAAYSGDFFGAAVSGGRVEVSGFNIAALGNLPVSAQLSVFGKVGLFFWEAEANDFTAGLGTFSVRNDGTDVSFGVGASFELTRNLSVRVEWERFRVELFGEADVDLFSAGLAYRFY